MWRHHLSADEAFRRVHRVRPWVAPNPGFRQQLERFEGIGGVGCWGHVRQGHQR
ncbi:hypothetical protein TSOC_009041 [Tetrabaena socialis]|uniref:Uncharacterized protein n=1 Tax=Tetrabaena socialis TaxID=47790 RepID=A0A2J7ZWR2_9CHLO|nr:hypothetical protein TSOC_009041 [Tetrabaena socialis]|eukprot:PNH04721.1 hypothetical protein TSOC_009041 [Tetrabaena socialis]